MKIFKSKSKIILKEMCILLLILVSYIMLGLYISKDSVPNQEGYFEQSWNMIYINFNKVITSSDVTPLIFIFSAIIHKTMHISLSNSWKVMDLMFSGFTVIFLTYIYWVEQKPKNLLQKLAPPILIFTSIGYVYSFTSGSGEGIPTFFALIGTYLWQKRKFEYAVLPFAISYLSKYTMYLIAPGLLIWTLLNLKNFSKMEISKIILSGLLLLIVALLYLSFKNWGDLSLQVPYISNFSIAKAGHYLNFYLFTFFVGAPIIAIFYFLKPSPNIYWILALSAFLMLTRRYFYWNHTQQIIVFALAYLVTHKDAPKFLSFKSLAMQTLFSLCTMAILPIYSYNLPLFHKHMTIEESRQIQEAIYDDYHGGEVGYYLNRRFDEPYPNYEISYMGTSSKILIENTEYVVIPTVSGIPSVLLNYPQCRYTYYKQIDQNTIYKVQCNENEK